MTSRTRADDDRLVGSVARLCARATEPLDLLRRVARLVRAHLPYDAAGWILVDPDTMLLNAVHEEGVPREAHLVLLELELSGEDLNRFVDLAREGVAAASLAGATGGRLDRSVRWRTVYEPHGFGDELRGVFCSGGVCWGHVCLTRTAQAPWFTPREVGLLSRIAPHVAHGIRSGLLLDEAWLEPGREPPGVVVLDDDGRVVSTTPRALDWLGPVHDDRLERSMVVHEVAVHARAMAAGDLEGPPPLARVRAASGEWLLVRGSRLDGQRQTAVLVEPARRSDVAPLLLHLHELTPRERQVAQHLLSGRSTADIAADLWITQETLRGHVKSVFAKLGVSSRPELFARLAHEAVARSAGTEG